MDILAAILVVVAIGAFVKKIVKLGIILLGVAIALWFLLPCLPPELAAFTGSVSG